MRKGALLLVIVAITLASPVWAQEDPHAGLVDEVIVVPLEGRSIAAIVTHKPGVTKFAHAIALFPGSPGYGNFRLEDGKVKIDKIAGNFLIRARRHFLEDDVVTVVLDAPSDYQSKFPHAFRATDRYGQDVRAVVDLINKRFGAPAWTFIGTSEGSISAAHAGRMLSDQAKRVVLTATLVDWNYQGRGLSVADAKGVGVPLLWVHHKDDPCKVTPYFRAQEYAKATQAPLVTVTGASGVRGEPCEARTQHGFVGMEIKTIKAIMSWVRTGQPPPDVTE